MPLKQITNFLKQTNELEVASILLDTFSKYSRENFQFDELAMLYYEIKQYKKSAYYSEKSLVLSKDSQQMYSARSNLAKIYNHMNEPQKALKNIKLNLSVNPNDYEQRMEYIFTLYLLADHIECEKMLRELLLDPYLPEHIKDRVNFNLGTYEIEKGNFKEGFRMFTQDGKKVNVFSKITPPTPNMEEWVSGEVTNKKVLVLHRGGIGDELINIRFMKQLTEKGLDPIWLTSFKDLKTVFNRNGYKTISNISELVNPQDYVYCSSMDLPCILELEKDELGHEPYIKPDQTYVEKWKHISGIGIKWSGNKDYEHDLHRSLSLDAIIDVVKDCNKQIYSLQKEDFEGIEKYSNVIDLHSELNTIEDTLAIIWNLDYVITSCTSIAHMAGSMGKRVYVLPPISCYYTWQGRSDNKSDWYNDNVTVIKQTEWNSWSTPLESLKLILQTEGK